MKVKPYIILNMSRLHVNYEEDKNKVPMGMNKPYNIKNTNICNGIFHISFFKALLINEGEATWGERGSGRTEIGANRIRGETTQIPVAVGLQQVLNKPSNGRGISDYTISYINVPTQSIMNSAFFNTNRNAF